MTDRKFTHPDDTPEGHEWETRDGKPVRIYATDGGGEWPIHGAVMIDGGWQQICWRRNGVYCSDGAFPSWNIVDKPRTHTVWVNMYPNMNVIAYPSRLDADRNASDRRIACVPVTYTDGEGLGDD